MRVCAATGFAFLILLAGAGNGPLIAGGIATQPEAALNPLRVVGKADLTGFRQHPLFDPSRQEARPPEPPPETAPPPSPVPEPEPPPPIHLVGIINGAENFAIVRLDTSPKTSILGTGDKLGSWSVAVTPRGLSLANDRQTLTYGLFTKGGAAAPGAVPALPSGSAGSPSP